MTEPETNQSARHPLAAPRWDLYNASNAGRAPRLLTRRALEELASDSGGNPQWAARLGKDSLAVELGSGSGVDSRFLESVGLTVHSFDADPNSSGGRHHHVVDLGELASLPKARLVLSNSTLSFLAPSSVRSLLALVSEALRPDGVLAVDFFGRRDDWAGGPGTYPTPQELRRWLHDNSADGAGDRGDEAPAASSQWPTWKSLEIHEEEWDGTSFSGPKHWHVVTVLGRR